MIGSAHLIYSLKSLLKQNKNLHNRTSSAPVITSSMTKFCITFPSAPAVAKTDPSGAYLTQLTKLVCS